MLVGNQRDCIPSAVVSLNRGVAGIIGLMLSWQWVYMTSTYLVSFFVARRHTLLSRRDMYIYIVAINSFWILCALLGIYVSIALVVNGDYRVLGL